MPYTASYDALDSSVDLFTAILDSAFGNFFGLIFALILAIIFFIIVKKFVHFVSDWLCMYARKELGVTTTFI